MNQAVHPHLTADRAATAVPPPHGFVARAIDTYRGWGTDQHMRTVSWECQKYVPEPNETFFRCVRVAAPKEIVWRWMCQLRVAPYSYDWLDNAGRESPRILTPGAERLTVGQRILIIFRIVEFNDGESMTLRVAPHWRWLWGNVTCTYKTLDNGDGTCGLYLALSAHSIPGKIAGPTGLFWVRKFFFPWGELAMVRKQLLTIKTLAEQQAGTAVAPV